MGCKISCKLFEQFSSFIHWLVTFRSKRETMDHYLDDFIFAGQAQSQECQLLVETFEKSCSDLGVPIATNKSEGPTTKMVFLGLEI